MTSDYGQFTSFNAERGRLMSPVEVERSRPVAVIGWDVADELFGQTDPLEKSIRVAGVPFRVVGISEKKGSFFGNSQDAFVVIPLGAYQKLFGARQSLQIVVKPRTPAEIQAAKDDATVALRVTRRLKPGADDNFGMFTSDTFLDLYRQATAGHLRRAGRRGGAVARRRRHRHHEHHADGGQRAHARNRACARRSARGGPTSCRRCSPSRSRCRSSAASSG